MKQILLLFLFLLCIAPFAMAQSGIISGLVLNHDKKPIAGANVQVMKNNLTISRMVTNAKGRYSTKPVPAGTYKVKINHMSYEPYKKSGVIIQAGKTTSINTELDLNAKELAPFAVVAYRPSYMCGGLLTERVITSEPIETTRDTVANSTSVKPKKWWRTKWWIKK